MREIDSFLEKVSSQIKTKRTKRYVQLELSHHLEQSKQKWIERGFNDLDAEKKAVEEMGDPYKIGSNLNKTHATTAFSYFKPWFVHIIIVIISALMFNVLQVMDQLIVNHIFRLIIYVAQTALVICLYFYFGRKLLSDLPKRIIYISVGSLLVLNLAIALSGYVMMNSSNHITAENGQFPIMLLMVFNHSFHMILTSISVIPDIINILLISILSPLFLYIGSKNKKTYLTTH
ncbi:permease prefix domain 1-containing protein [Piscibacillus salipiscarius]|uniref:Permease prefix domain 1-containing protein n=1 Tax=Piscibacillus salipiscarius TaxID=299480 RepID=A0ABW5QBX7_9BACI